jgi:hypothetical protein
VSPRKWQYDAESPTYREAELPVKCYEMLAASDVVGMVRGRVGQRLPATGQANVGCSW